MTAPAPPAPQVPPRPVTQPPGVTVPAPRAPVPPTHAAPTRPARPRRSSTTPAILQSVLIGLVLASVVWGAVGAWTVSQHASAANEIVTTSEPLSLAAQQMYQSLSDADVTATTAYLAGSTLPLSERQRFNADLSNAGADLATLRSAGSASSQITAALTAISTGLPVYAEYVTQAQSYAQSGLPLPGGSVIESASEEMHLTLLPAASAIYAQESSALAAASAQATGLPWIVVSILLAVAIGLTLARTQRWLHRRTHRLVNYGLLLASVAIVVTAVWLVAAFLSARSDFHQGIGHGSTPAEELAQSVIAAQQARGDQVLNLISRTGSTSFSKDFGAEKTIIGPGSGSLLTSAGASSLTGGGAAAVTAAEHAAAGWYATSAFVFRLDAIHQYADETALVVGTSPGSSGAGFALLIGDLRQGISADQAVFSSNAAAGSGAFGGLEAAVIIAALLMAAGSAWGLSRRLAEYR